MLTSRYIVTKFQIVSENCHLFHHHQLRYVLLLVYWNKELIPHLLPSPDTRHFDSVVSVLTQRLTPPSGIASTEATEACLKDGKSLSQLYIAQYTRKWQAQQRKPGRWHLEWSVHLPAFFCLAPQQCLNGSVSRSRTSVKGMLEVFMRTNTFPSLKSQTQKKK